MNDLKKTCRAALVQAAPVLFDKAACTDKAVKLIAKCAEGKARFIVFPELFIPGYPYGMSFGFTVGHREEDGRSDWTMYYENSILVPGEETARLARAAKEAGAWKWKKDRVTGKHLDEPVEVFDDAMAALRYAIEDVRNPSCGPTAFRIKM